MSGTARRTVGLFGGSFNPPHVSHVLICDFALCAWPLDEILVIPNNAHPLGKRLEPYEHRLRMTELAFHHLSSRITVSRIEEELGGVSYTIDTVRELSRRDPHSSFRLIVGSDILSEASRWKDYDTLVTLAPLLIVPRLGNGPSGDLRDFYVPAVSSTEIRRQLSNGEDPGLAVPWAVRDYIRAQRLYSDVTDETTPCKPIE